MDRPAKVLFALRDARWSAKSAGVRWAMWPEWSRCPSCDRGYGCDCLSEAVRSLERGCGRAEVVTGQHLLADPRVLPFNQAIFEAAAALRPDDG